MKSSKPFQNVPANQPAVWILAVFQFIELLPGELDASRKTSNLDSLTRREESQSALH